MSDQDLFDREFRGIVRYNFMPKTRPAQSGISPNRLTRISALVSIVCALISIVSFTIYAIGVM